MNQLKNMCYILCLFCSGCVLGSNYPAKVVVQIQDEVGGVISGATVKVSFEQNSDAQHTFRREGSSDEDGIYTVTERTSGYVYVNVSKEGYYPSKKILRFDYNFHPDSGFKLSGKEHTIILREIKNPIPMYVKRVDWIELPKLEEPIGFDFEKGDWVAPYGKGKRADMFFLGTKNIGTNRYYDATLEISFPHAFDGLLPINNVVIESKYPLSYKAPFNFEYGSLIFTKGKTAERGHYATPFRDREVIGYFFRIRSEKKENGDLKSARYGKIVGAIEYEPRNRETMIFHFIYYLNPTENDRNLEFDPEHNLFDDSFRYDP